MKKISFWDEEPPLKSCHVVLPEPLLHAVHERAFGEWALRDGASLVFAERDKDAWVFDRVDTRINDMRIYH